MKIKYLKSVTPLEYQNSNKGSNSNRSNSKSSPEKESLSKNNL